MYVYQVEADAAFDVLNWRSQETNVKLRALAEQLLADIRTLKHDESESYRSDSTGYCSPPINASGQSSEETLLGTLRPVDRRFACIGNSPRRRVVPFATWQ